MINPVKLLPAFTLVFAAALNSHAQHTASAPASLPTPCIIRFVGSSQLALTSEVLTVLYKANGTYSTWSDHYASASWNGTETPNDGTYTYAVDPKDPTHATIMYTYLEGPTPPSDLYFATTTSGTYSQPPDALLGLSPTYTTFTLYPAQASSGGVNLSTRTTLTAGGHAIVGFVIGGTAPRWVLLRADGVSLKQFGVSSTVTSPSFTVWDNKDKQVGASSVWSADPNLVPGFSNAFSLTGAFPLDKGSDEGVLLLPLKPGAYTMVLSAKSAGNVLGEVYFLPF